MTKAPVGHYVDLSVLWFAFSAQWSVLNAVLLPLGVLMFVQPEQKGTYLALVMGTGTLVAILVQPMIGVLSDNTKLSWGRRRPYILAGVLVNAVPLALLMKAPDYSYFFALVIAIQVASNIAQGPYQALIPDLVPQKDRGLASGFVGVMGVSGQVFGGVLTMILLERERFVEATWVIVALSLMLVTWTCARLRERPLANGVDAVALSSLRQFYRIDFNAYRDFVWLIISRFFFLLGFNTIVNFAQYFLKDIVEVPNPASTTALFAALLALGAMISIVPGGRLSDRIGRKSVIYSAAFLAVIAISLLMTTKSVLLLGSYVVLFGMAGGLFLAVDWALATDLVPKNESGKYMGLSNLATAGSALVAWVIGGPISDYFNSFQSGLGYYAIFFIAILYIICGVFFLRPISEARPE